MNGVHGDDPPADRAAPRTAAPTSRALRAGLEAAGVVVWSVDPTDGRLRWTLAAEESPDGEPCDEAVERLVHPADRSRLRRAVRAALGGGAPLDLQLRPNDPGRANDPDRTDDADGPGGAERRLLIRGRLVRDGREEARLTGVLLEVTDHRAADRLRHGELRAAALHHIVAALAEAGTGEQVAAVMVQESLRHLGAGAARIELEPTRTPHARRSRVVRTAGVARLLTESRGVERLELRLSSRGRPRGHWTIAWPADTTDRGGVGERGAEWRGAEGADLLGALAAECAQALERAEVSEQQRRIASVLQRTLLPSVLPPVRGAAVAARYRPGGEGVDVGGDWYDVIALPDGRTGLVIGDVEGHSAEAAAVMGQVRGALRAYAAEGSTPALVMERLNRLLIRLQVTPLVTCCYVEFSADEGTATVVLAGHPPPLVVRGDRTGYVGARPNLVLGVQEAVTFVESTVLLDPGDTILLYTDGLVEDAGHDVAGGLDTLRDRVGSWDVEDGVDALVEGLARRTDETGDDDVALLALRYEPTVRRLPGPRRAVRRTLPLDPASASASRRFVADVLAQWGLEDLVAQVALMTSELVTNSVLHTSGDLRLALCLDLDELRVEVIDRSERLPTVQTPDDEATGGRGLLIVEALSDRWGVAARGDGKAVWFTVALPPTRGPGPRVSPGKAP